MIRKRDGQFQTEWLSERVGCGPDSGSSVKWIVSEWRRNPSRIDVKRGDHFPQADFSVLKLLSQNHWPKFK